MPIQMKINKDLIISDTNTSLGGMNDELEKLKKVILYENAAGTLGNITLNDNVENYSYIEVFFAQYQLYGTSAKIKLSDTRNMCLTTSYLFNKVMFLDAKGISFSGKTLKVDYNIASQLTASVQTMNQENIKIYRVIGYK